MSSKSFEDILKQFVNATKNSQKHALTLSHMGLEHFKEHGDVSYLQKFFDAMPQNYLRRAALVAWACEFAPIKVEGRKFMKDQKRRDEEVNLEGAFKKPFWDFKPEQEIWNYSVEDVKQQVLRIVNRCRNTEKAEAADENALKLVDRLEAFINGKGASTAPAEAANTTDEDIEGAEAA